MDLLKNLPDVPERSKRLRAMDLRDVQERATKGASKERRGFPARLEQGPLG
jgi:hypothetical protein